MRPSNQILFRLLLVCGFKVVAHGSADITNSVTWSSGDAGVATISDSPGSKELTTGVTIGDALITAALSGISGSTTLSVTTAVLPSISISPATASIAAGLTQQYIASGNYSDGSSIDLTTQVSWSASGGGSCATISNSSLTEGLASSVAQGSCSIGATFNSITATPATLTVTAAALASITVGPSAPSVALGNSQQFTVTGNFTDGSTLDVTSGATWSSNNTGVATINSSGLAATLTQGSAIIETTYAGFSHNTVLTVGPKIFVSINVTPSTLTLAKGLTQQCTATLAEKPVTRLNGVPTAALAGHWLAHPLQMPSLQAIPT